MRLLKRLDLHGDIPEAKSLALEIEHLVGQAREHELGRFGVDVLCYLRIRPVIFELDGYGAAAEADFEATAAQLIEHANFLDQAERMVERHRPNQRPETKPLRPLRDGGEEDARRGSHSQRRRMMLGEMIGVEAGAIIGLRYAQAVLVVIRERPARAVEMIEDTEFHFYLAGNDSIYAGCIARRKRP